MTAIAGPALRLWLRYLVPLTLLSALALSPVLALALLAPPGARATTGWLLVAFAVLGQLTLAGAASAMIGAPSQLRALTGGLAQLARAILPCLAAMLAVGIGGLALAVPGAILLVLLALTGTSPARGVTAALTDSVAAARPQWIAVTLTIAATLALDLAIHTLTVRALVGPLPHQPTPTQLAVLRPAAHVIAIALVAISPLPASTLAVLRARRP